MKFGPSLKPSNGSGVPRSTSTDFFTLKLTAINVGQAIWLAKARHNKGEVSLEWRWFKDGKELSTGSGGTRIRYEVFPGQRYEFQVSVDPPLAPGRYVLELGLVSEHVARFADAGTPPVRIPLEVQ